MAAHAARLSRLFTPEYARRINAQLVHPAQSIVVKPNELESALARPLHLAYYEPHQTAPYLAATLSYGIIKGHPFVDGNKRTGFFLANEYIRATGSPGLADFGVVGDAYASAVKAAEPYMGVAAGTLELEDIAKGIKSK